MPFDDVVGYAPFRPCPTAHAAAVPGFEGCSEGEIRVPAGGSHPDGLGVGLPKQTAEDVSVASQRVELRRRKRSAVSEARVPHLVVNEVIVGHEHQRGALGLAIAVSIGLAGDQLLKRIGPAVPLRDVLFAPATFVEVPIGISLGT